MAVGLAGAMAFAGPGAVTADPTAIVLMCEFKFEPENTLAANGVPAPTPVVVGPDGKAEVRFDNIENMDANGDGTEEPCPGTPNRGHRPMNDGDNAIHTGTNFPAFPPNPGQLGDGTGDCFDGGAIGVGASKVVVIDFNKPECLQAVGADGILDYHCSFHWSSSGMVGSLRVIGL